MVWSVISCPKPFLIHSTVTLHFCSLHEKWDPANSCLASLPQTCCPICTVSPATNGRQFALPSASLQIHVHPHPSRPPIPSVPLGLLPCFIVSGQHDSPVADFPAGSLDYLQNILHIAAGVIFKQMQLGSCPSLPGHSLWFSGPSLALSISSPLSRNCSFFTVCPFAHTTPVLSHPNYQPLPGPRAQLTSTPVLSTFCLLLSLPAGHLYSSLRVLFSYSSLACVCHFTQD